MEFYQWDYVSGAVLSEELCSRFDAVVHTEPTARQGFDKLKTLFPAIEAATSPEVRELIEDEFDFAFQRDGSIETEGWTFSMSLDEALEQIRLQGEFSDETWENVLSAIQRWCLWHSN